MAAISSIIAGTAALAAVGGTAVAAKGVSNAKKAADAAANTPAPQVNIAQTDQMARDAARRNAVESAALEREFNPGAAELRQGSLAALLGSLSDPERSQILSSFAERGAPAISTPGARAALSEIAARPGMSATNAELLSRVAAQAGQPLTNQGFDSALTRDAVARASADLALGGELPQDVRNLVARRALARSGTVSGGLALGRDLTARDLGLTTLDLRNQRLQAAAQLGAQEANLEQANAAMRAQAEQYGRANLLQSQAVLDEQDARAAQNYATDAQIRAQRDALMSQNYATDAQLAAQRDALGSQNYFNQANLLQNIQSGDFARLFQAAQLGQNIAQPLSGLDPSAIANLAVGNVNAQAGAQQQGFGLRAGAANQQAQFGSQLAGTGLGIAAQFYKPQPVSPKITYDAYKAANPYSTAVIGQGP